MPIPTAVTRWNKRVLNPVLVHLVGHGPFVEMEHVGRSSGRVYRTTMMAFRSADHPEVVTIALTYGTHTDWLRNVRAAGGCRMRLGGDILTLGPPRSLTTEVGMSRMPFGPRQILPLTRTRDFVELPVVAG